MCVRVCVYMWPKNDAWNGWFPQMGGASNHLSRIFVKLTFAFHQLLNKEGGFHLRYVV